MKIRLLIFSVFVILINACGKDDAPPPPEDKSSAKQLTAFTFRAVDNATLDADVVASINEDSKSVETALPGGTDLTGLIPAIEVSSKASFSPTGAQNFTTNVKYTVTAEDGSVVDYLASAGVTNRPPGAFNLLEVIDNADDVALLPTFKWETATDPDGDTVTYDLYLDIEEEPLVLVIEKLNTPNYTLQIKLDFDQEYQWKVVAKDEKGALTESAVQSFSTMGRPIVFLKSYYLTNQNYEQQFTYSQGNLTSLEDISGRGWNATFDMSLNKPSRFTGSEGGALGVSFDYTYTSEGNQEMVQSHYEDFLTENWSLEYDSQDRIVLISNNYKEDGPSNDHRMATFMYSDNVSTNPSEITIEENGDNEGGPYDYVRRITLEWDGENISALQIEVDEKDGNGFQFGGRKEYIYDNNINPYYILVDQQFKWPDFFVTNFRTDLETINFGAFYWQSANSIVRIDSFDTPNASEPAMVWEYNYTYTEAYYPSSARLAKTNEGETDTQVLIWTY